ncbi:MAG: hypothetical protein QHH15_07480 [Candidatus Thermoplasmatota archaeon]|jgi:hypothetical protein|nr:hypothetical protein [Candidatus Thermoplasmatota archaeon]
MFSGKEKIIPVLAISVLLVGIFSAIYVNATQINKNTLTINGHEYTIDYLFSICKKRVIETDKGAKTGIALDDLILKVGVSCPTCYEYVIKAKDKYQQTLNWDVLKTGVLTDYGRVFFPDIAHTFWIRDVIEIEVK